MSNSSHPDKAIVVKDLRKSYGDLKVLRGIIIVSVPITGWLFKRRTAS